MDRYVFMNPIPDWSSAWLVFAGYMVAVALLFAVFFKEKDKKA